MSDPIKDLESFPAEGIPVTPLHPAEVRRRGDRMRRRRQAGAALAGVAAIAVIATPLALLAGGDERSQTPDPASPSELVTTEGPDRSYVTEIPAGFPLTLGYPAANGNDGSPVEAVPGEEAVGAFELCGTPTWSYDDTVDVLGARYTGEAEDSRGRVLVLYPSDQAAARALDNLTDAVIGCPEEPVEGGESTTTRLHERHDASAGGQDGELVFTQRYRVEGFGFDTGLTAYTVTRTGNALLLTYEYGEGGSSDESVRLSLDHVTNQAQAVAQEMCVFAANPCRVGGEPAETDGVASGPARTVPDGFPLDRGLEGELDPRVGVTLVACDRELWPVDGFADRARMRALDEMTSEAHEVVVFADAASAVAALDGVRTGMAGCDTQVNEQDPTANPEQAWTRHEADTGFEDSLTFSLTYLDGALGGRVWQFTRVGNAILALAWDGETNLDAAPLTVNRLTTVTRQLTPEMCVFTADGC